MKQLLTIILLITSLICSAQKKDTCIGLGSIGVQMNYPDYKLSPKAYAAYDTMPRVVWLGSGRMFRSDTYEDYKNLSTRNKHIVDSLQDAGLQQLSESYLAYEPHYMQVGKKAEQFWNIRGQNVVIYEYLFWKSEKSSGFKLLKEITVK